MDQEIKKALKRQRENWIGEQCQNIDDCLKKNNSKKAYKLVQDLTGTKQERTTTIQDKGGTCLTENENILKSWTEYSSELYNYRATGDSEVLNVPPASNNANYPILREEVEAAVKSLKKGKSAGVDNIPAELLQQGGEAMVNALLICCNNIWRTGDWPTPWTQSLVITLPKNGNWQLCQNYRTISLISHPSKDMLKIILNRLKPEAERIIAEEQTGFRPGSSTTEQIFNLRILCEKYLQHQWDLYHVFIDFKKAFDRVWHAALWAIMRLYIINTNLINAIQNLYDKATSAVCFNGSTGGWFRATVEVRLGWLLSPILFNIFLERIMADWHLKIANRQSALGGRTISNLRFADDIEGLAGSELELANLVKRLDETSTAYGMEISADKNKLMTNNTNGISSNIRVNGEKLKTVQSFKYLGAIVTDGGSMPEIRSRISQTIAALTKLRIIWDDKIIDLSSKIRLLRSLVMFIFLYSRETLTLTAEIGRKIQAVEMIIFRRLLGIAYKDHITNEEVRSRIRKSIGPYEELLSTVKDAKWSGMGMSQELRDLPRQCSRALYGEGEGEADRENDGKMTCGIGRVWNWTTPWGEQRNERNGEC